MQHIEKENLGKYFFLIKIKVPVEFRINRTIIDLLGANTRLTEIDPFGHILCLSTYISDFCTGSRCY